MARNFFQIFTEYKPVRRLRKKYNIPDVNWLSPRGRMISLFGYWCDFFEFYMFIYFLSWSHLATKLN